MENKSKLKKSAIVFGIILALFLVFALAMFIIKIIFPYVRKTEFNSVNEFVSEGGYVYYDVPECAENLLYYYRETPFYGFRSIISFEINDSEEYDIFMEDLKDYVFYPVSLSKSSIKITKFSRKKLSKNLAKFVPVAFSLFFVWFLNVFYLYHTLVDFLSSNELLY